MNASTPTVTSPGTESGSKMRQEEPMRLAPSITACLLELVRDRAQERHEDDDRRREREPDLRDDHPEERSVQVELPAAAGCQSGKRRDGHGEHEPGGEEARRAPPATAEA